MSLAGNEYVSSPLAFWLPKLLAFCNGQYDDMHVHKGGVCELCYAYGYCYINEFKCIKKRIMLWYVWIVTCRLVGWQYTNIQKERYENEN